MLYHREALARPNIVPQAACPGRASTFVPPPFTLNAIGLVHSLSGKWLELLKQIAPGTVRAATLWDPTRGAGSGLFAAI